MSTTSWLQKSTEFHQLHNYQLFREKPEPWTAIVFYKFRKFLKLPILTSQLCYGI